jgi:hypothetical protein
MISGDFGIVIDPVCSLMDHRTFSVRAPGVCVWAPFIEPGAGPGFAAFVAMVVHENSAVTDNVYGRGAAVRTGEQRVGRVVVQGVRHPRGPGVS